MNGVTIRAARPSDRDRFAEIIHGAPNAESVAISGSVSRARRLGSQLVRLESRHRSRTTMAAVLDDRVVAVFAYSDDNDRASRVRGLAHLWTAMQTLGPIGMAGWIHRTRVRQRVQPELPSGCFYLAEIDVDPAYRNLGIGSHILHWIEREAIRHGHRQITLRVTLTNPAVRFYQRHGFTITASVTDERYEALTGSPGRALMHKWCSPIDEGTAPSPGGGRASAFVLVEELPPRS